MDMWILGDEIIHPPSVASGMERAQKEAMENEQRELEIAHLERIAKAEMVVNDVQPEGGDAGMRTRRKKRKVGGGDDDGDDIWGDGSRLGGMDSIHDEHEGLDEASLREHEEVTKVKNVNEIEMGNRVMECWYFSPFPKEYYPNGFTERLYFCEYTLNFFRHKEELLRWSKSAAPPPHPPGNEIYRCGSLSMFEVDGSEQQEYCQNLSYLAKLFLDHKTLYYDVDPFLFYVLCEVDKQGFHIVGYFR